MKLFDFFKSNKPEPQSIIEKQEFSEIKTFNYNLDFGKSDYQLNKTANGYLYGAHGLFPQELNNLYNHSPLHSAILNFKRLSTVGNGYVLTEPNLSGKAQIEVNQLTNQFDKILSEISMDYFIHSRICLEVLWNSDNTKILKIKRLAPEKVRIYELDSHMEAESYIYNWDWNFHSKYKSKIYPKFDQMNKKDKCQLFVYQTCSPGQKLYAEPSYISCLEWVILDSEMGQYHKANITNSINPSVLIQYFEKPATKEEKQQVLFDLNNSFGGARKTGRAMVTFSDNKDLAPTVTQMEANKLDKTFLQLTDTIQRQICYSHQINPTLLGLKTPGSLGDAGDFVYSYNIYVDSIVKPAQNVLEGIMNEFIAINGLGVKVKLNEPKPIEQKPE